MIAFAHLLTTSLASLACIAAGWGAGRVRLLPDAALSVEQLNAFVLKCALPCLQVWLLACKSDLHKPGSWGALVAFLAWSLLMQALLAAHQLATSRRLDLARLGVDSLLLTTNNTGILGPLVLESALGPRWAPLGVLATVTLYWQQLPSAQLLFELHKRRARDSSRRAASAHSPRAQQLWRPPGPTESLLHAQPEVHVLRVESAAAAASSGGGDSAGLTAARGAALLLLQNPLLLTTTGSLLLSTLGSSALLNPASPSALRPLAWVEELLAWFAATTAPLTLFTTGLWMSSQQAQQQQQQQQQQQHEHQQPRIGAPSSGPGQARAPGDEGLSWAQLGRVLLLRATAAPAMMALVCWLSGFRGDAAHALIILSLLPLAQTAFVVCKAADVGTVAVSQVLVASTMLALPQLLLILAVLEATGVLAT